MDPQTAQNLIAAQEQLRTTLTAATADLMSMPAGEGRTRGLRDLATILVGATEEIRASAVRQCPDLETAEPFPDTRLDAAGEEFAARITQSDLNFIDRALVENTVSSWRKVARVVGATMVTVDDQFPGISLGFYVQRVEALVQSGQLQAQGNIQFMRLSEVRLPATGKSAA